MDGSERRELPLSCSGVEEKAGLISEVRGQDGLPSWELGQPVVLTSV